jgi:hypothetical protein
MSLINQEITYVASTNIGASCVLYEFSVSPSSGVFVTPGNATLNSSTNTNNTLKLTFTVAGTYTVNVVAKSSCSTQPNFQTSVVEVVGTTPANCDPISPVTPNTQSGFRYLTPSTRRFQFGNEDGIKFLNQDGSIDKNQMRIVYNSATNTISDLDWAVNNYNLPKSWRINTEPFKTTPLQNIVIPTFMYGKPITVEVQYYDGNPQVHRYYPFQQSFIIN